MFLHFVASLCSGAEILGTVMRCAWFPFTYEQKMTPNDKRTDIPKKGHKAVHMKEVTHHGKKLVAQGYNTGTGKVVLSMPTFYRKRIFNFDLRHSSDARWYHDKTLSTEARFLKGFTPFRSRELDLKLKELLLLTPVQPLSIDQGTPEWWML